MILCVGATPAAQRVMIFRNLVLDSVNRAVRTLDGAAGKSVNVAKVLRALGETPVALGFIGGDRGNEISAALKARGIEVEFVAVDARTRQCVTVIDESTSSVTELVEESQPLPESAYESLISKICHRIGTCRAVVMSGTLTPGGPVDLCRRCVQWGHEAGALSVVDTKGAVLIEALKARPGLVKPNREELAATVGCELGDEAAVLAAMAQLRTKGAERVVVTAGKAPCLASDGRGLWRIRPPLIQAVNPIGSGDAFTAGLVWRLARGDDLGEACRWAAAAGAANAMTIMAGEVDPKQVSSLVSEAIVERL